MNSCSRHFLVAASILAATSATPDARADDGPKQACVDAHIEGQRARDDGKLKAARQEFLACAVESCPAPLRKDCLQWLGETEATLPTLLIRVQRAGQDTADVSVAVDGESVASRLTGMPIAVDPGERVLRFVSVDGRTKEERVFVTAGEKGRRVTVDFSSVGPSPSAPGSAPPPSPPTESAPSRIPSSVYVLGATAAVAMGSFAVFGVKAFTQGNHLKDSCAPTCSTSDSSAVHRDALIADVSLGVGVVAAVAATWILLTHRDAPSGLVVAPTARGSVVGWQARF